MKRLWTHVVGAVSAIGGLAVLSPACAHDDSSLFLNTVLAPPQGAATGGCIFTADPTQAHLSSGLLDVQTVQAFANSYTAWFLAGNQIIPQGNQQLLDTETSRIIVYQAEVTVTAADGTQLANYTAPGTAEIDPSAGDTPGYAAVSFEIVDPTTIKTLQGQLKYLEEETILTYTKAVGRTLGGDTVESNTFEFPITVCNGCLVGFDSVNTQITLANGTMEDSPTPNCCGLEVTSTNTFCYAGQDSGFVDCHTCLNSAFCRCGPNATAQECAAITTTCDL
jgi:hypothetical protein